MLYIDIACSQSEIFFGAIIHSQETKARIVIAITGKPHKGQPMSEEEKKKLSEVKKKIFNQDIDNIGYFFLK